MSLQALLVRNMLSRADLWSKPLEEIRGKLESVKANPLPKEVRHTIEEINSVQCECFDPINKRSGRTILYFHGGGFCLGIYPTNRAFAARVASNTRCTVIMPNYRLAPEHAYPAAHEDGLAVYEGLQGQQRNEAFTFAGDSVGCALALSVAMQAKRKGCKLPSDYQFITPVLNLMRYYTPDAWKKAKDPFRLSDPLSLVRNYMPADHENCLPDPLDGDLAGLGQFNVVAAGRDVFLDDAILLRQRVMDAGGEIQLEVWKNMWHIFPMQYDLVPEAKKALAGMFPEPSCRQP